jgi:hypothetical protein
LFLIFTWLHLRGAHFGGGTHVFLFAKAETAVQTRQVFSTFAAKQRILIDYTGFRTGRVSRDEFSNYR